MRKQPGCSSFLHASTHTHTYTDPHPHNHAHTQTLKTNTQTPPKTPPTVTTSEEWSACGEVVVRVGGEVEMGEGTLSATFNPQKVSDIPWRPERVDSTHPKLMGTRREEARTPFCCFPYTLICGNTVITLDGGQTAPSQLIRDTQDRPVGPFHQPMSSEKYCSLLYNGGKT